MSWLKHLIKKHLDKVETVEIQPKKREEVLKVSEKSYQEIKEVVNRVSVDSKTLGNEDKTEVIRMIALYKKNSEIIKFLSEQRGIDVTTDSIDYYRRSAIYKDVIHKARQDFESRIADVEFSSKRRRVEELTDIFWLLKDAGKLKAASEVINFIESMMEPKKTGDVNVQFNQFNGMSDDELKHRLQANIITLETKKIEESYASKIRETEEDDGHSRTSSGQTLQEE